MIAILLATYNGARWLPELLESLQRQTFADWRLLVRDDDSSDETPRLLADAAARDPQITLLADGDGRLGVTANFGRLMETARLQEARAVFFADQDDVWLPHKLARQLDALNELERTVGHDTPLLVHSNLAVVDASLRTIHRSHTEFARLQRELAGEAALRHLLMHNFVTGCASLINRPLLEISLPLPPAAVLHDWWIALCAATFGQLHYLPEPLVLYRNHGGNVVGTSRLRSRLGPRHVVRHWQRALRNFVGGVEQAQALQTRMADERRRTDNAAANLIANYCRVFKTTHRTCRQLLQIRRLGIGRTGLLHRVVLAAQLFQFTPRSSGSL